MNAKCPYCANSKPIVFEPASDDPQGPQVASCGHCRRVLGVTANTAAMQQEIASLRQELAQLRSKSG